MFEEEINTLFLKELRSCCTKKKYSGQFTEEDEKKAIHALELVLETPSLSENLIFDMLTGETE